MASTQLPYLSDLLARTSVVKDYRARARVQGSGLRVVMVASRTRGARGWSQQWRPLQVLGENLLR
eukprot:11186606-Lingulodinium_polyedra.AAC.1